MKELYLFIFKYFYFICLQSMTNTSTWQTGVGETEPSDFVFQIDDVIAHDW